MELAEKVTGKKPTTTGVIQDNTAAPVSFMKPMRAGGFEKAGLKVLVDEIYTPPLSDATPLVSKVRTSRPDFVWVISTSIPDDSLLVQKFAEMGIGPSRLPIVGNGAHFGAPELLKVAGADVLEGILIAVANWSNEGQRQLIDEFKKRTGEPWLTQDSLSAYGHVWILKEAVEKAGLADRRKVAEAIRAMDTSEGAAKYFAGNHIKFDEKGRRAERRAQSVCIARAKLAPVNRRVMQELVVAAGRIGGTLQTDDAAQLVLMLGGELEHDSAAHRTSQDHGLLDLERLPDRADDTEIGFGREPIPHQPPVGGWVRPAVPGKIECDDPELARHVGIVKHMAELAAVGAGGVQAQERNAAARLFDENPIVGAVEPDGQIAADNRLEFSHRRPPCRA
jgi:hypothetical protein